MQSLLMLFVGLLPHQGFCWGHPLVLELCVVLVPAVEAFAQRQLAGLTLVSAILSLTIYIADFTSSQMVSGNFFMPVVARCEAAWRIYYRLSGRPRLRRHSHISRMRSSGSRIVWVIFRSSLESWRRSDICWCWRRRVVMLLWRR